MRFLFLFLLAISLLTGGRLSAQQGFPADWTGDWTGELEIFNGQGKTQAVPMQLRIHPVDSSDRFTWVIVYGPDEPDNRRAYELVTLDAGAGRYRIDEKNSIELETYLLGDKLYSRFEVMGNWLLSSYERQGEDLIFEVVSGKSEPERTTGGTQLEGEEIPVVKSFALQIRQRAVLKRSPDRK